MSMRVSKKSSSSLMAMSSLLLSLRTATPTSSTPHFDSSKPCAPLQVRSFGPVADTQALTLKTQILLATLRTQNQPR